MRPKREELIEAARHREIDAVLGLAFENGRRCALGLSLWSTRILV